MSVPSSKVKQSKMKHCFTSEDGTDTLTRNFGNKLWI